MDISICILRDILSNQVLSRINLPPELRVSEVEDKQDLVEGDVGEGVRGDGGGGGDLPGGGERKTTTSQEHLLALRKESEASLLQLATNNGAISKSPSTGLSKYLTGAFLSLTKLVFPPRDHLENNKRTKFPVSRKLCTAGVESNIDGLTSISNSSNNYRITVIGPGSDEKCYENMRLLI